MDRASKRCSTCHLVRPLSDYNKRTAAPDGLQSRCRECAAAWYVANKTAHIANVRARNDRVRGEIRQRLIDHLLDHPCVDCGESDLRVLDFDHEDPTDKDYEVVRLAGFGVAWERVQAEIAKCSVRCANCHRRRTNEMFGYWRATVERDRRARQRDDAGRRLRTILAPPA